MAKVFLIGHPVAHSLSPAMHNAAFAALGLPHRYEARDIEPAALGMVGHIETYERIGDVRAWVRSNPIGMEHGALTLISRVVPEREGALSDILRSIGDDVKRGTLVPFSRLTRVHFARWVVLEDGRGGLELAFESNFDDDEESHLDELVGQASAGRRCNIALVARRAHGSGGIRPR